MINHDELRQRILRDEPVTREELREAIEQLRAERRTMAVASVNKRQVTKGMTDEELDADLDEMFASVKKKED